MKKLLMLFVCFTLAGLAMVKAQSTSTNDTEKKEATVTAGSVDGSAGATVSTDADTKVHKCSGTSSKKCCKKSKMSCCKKAKVGCNGKKDEAAPAGVQ